MRHHIGWIAILFLGALASAQSNKLKVYIAADMEGIGGVSTWEVQADTRVQLVRSWPRPLLMVQGIDPFFDALVLVGY